jgi:hypothetical protein
MDANQWNALTPAARFNMARSHGYSITGSGHISGCTYNGLTAIQRTTFHIAPAPSAPALSAPAMEELRVLMADAAHWMRQPLNEDVVSQCAGHVRLLLDACRRLGYSTKTAMTELAAMV